MWSIASTTSEIANLSLNSGAFMAIVIAFALVGNVALLGLGFGIQKTKQYITGKQF